MINNIKKRLSSLAVFSILAGALFVSCSDDINLSNIDDNNYDKAKDSYVSLKNYNDARDMQTVELRSGSTEIKVYLKLSKAQENTFSGKLKFDESVLNEYNNANGTDFKIFPLSSASIENGETVTIEKGKTESEPVTIKLKKDNSLEIGKSYILPVAFESNDSGIKTSSGEGAYLFVVKYMGNTPDAAKESGIVTIMYFEVNNTNILNAGEYMLKNSGKPFVDIVTIFAANINYNKETGRVFVSMNENVSHLLSNRDKYIKPLQDKGIRVNLSILGNHDAAGVANLSESTAKDFAKELKAIVDAYGLDGIDFDDEYSQYSQSVGVPGFITPSSNAYARLCYETKKIMPDKTVIVYHYGYVGFSQTVEGMNPGDFVDYTLEPYYGSFNNNITRRYLGMTNKQVSPYSRKIVDGLYKLPDGQGYYVGTYDMQTLKRVRDSEYGVNMLYDFNPAQSYVSAFNDFASVLYDDEIVFSGNTFEKDW